MEGEASKAQSEAPPQYSQPQEGPQEPQYGPPGQYGQPPVTMQPPAWGYPPPAPMPQQQQQQQTSVVVVNQQPVVKPLRAWSSGLCACCDDMSVCCCVTFCHLCAECQLATDMGESFCLPCCVPGWLIVLRTKLRTQHNIHGTVMDDCCTICCCHPCVMCQMMREVKLTRPMGVVVY